MIGILKSVAGLATTIIDSKAKVKAAEAETKMKLATGEISWEQAAIEASKDSWKDELWTIVFVLILCANFIPALQEPMKQGFENLKQCQRGYLGNVCFNSGQFWNPNNERFWKMTYKLSNRSLERLEGVDDKLIALAKYAIGITKVDFGIPHLGGLRTMEQQRELVNKGASQTMKSKHLEGIAIDTVVTLDKNILGIKSV